VGRLEVNLHLGGVMFRTLCVASIVLVILSASAFGELLGPAEFGTARMLYDADTGHVLVSANRAVAILLIAPATTMYETVASPAPGDLYGTFPFHSSVSVIGSITDLHLSNIDPHIAFNAFGLTYFRRPDGPGNIARCNDASGVLICVPEPFCGVGSGCSPFGIVVAIAGLRVGGNRE